MAYCLASLPFTGGAWPYGCSPESETRVPGSSPAQAIVFYSWEKHSNNDSPHLGEILQNNAGGYLLRPRNPLSKNCNTPCRFMVQKPG